MAYDVVIWEFDAPLRPGQWKENNNKSRVTQA